MGNPLYLAMTAAEFSACANFPEKIAWMACHFSPYGRGLSNIPRALPPGSMLILNDRIPPQGIDPSLVAKQLQQAVKDLGCEAVLLDFQRVEQELTQAVVNAVWKTMQCPVAVSAPYAEKLDCPVFLPPPPLRCEPAQYFAPWAQRQIWLEVYDQWEAVTITENSVQINTEAPAARPDLPHYDQKLCCRYGMDIGEDRAIFTLHRTMQELQTLPYPVSSFIALWQDYDS